MAKKKTSMMKEHKKAFLQAMEKTFGNITRSCKMVGIDRSLPYKWEADDPEFKEKFRSSEWGEMFKDMIEDKLSKLAVEENPTILIFIAKTKLKDRGYVEKQEIENINQKETVVINNLSGDKYTVDEDGNVKEK